MNICIFVFFFLVHTNPNHEKVAVPPSPAEIAHSRPTVLRPGAAPPAPPVARPAPETTKKAESKPDNLPPAIWQTPKAPQADKEPKTDKPRPFAPLFSNKSNQGINRNYHPWQ
jgi:hypothetical protein